MIPEPSLPTLRETCEIRPTPSLNERPETAAIASSSLSTSKSYCVNNAWTRARATASSVT